MKTKFLFGLLLTFSLSTFALQTTPATSADQVAWQECNAKIQGGADGFPWSVAKPFPWADIQGIWKLRDGAVPYYLKAKIIRTTSNRKILSLSVVSEGNCTKPIAQGIGYVDFSERNVIRAIINDGSAKYQIKLASFDVRDLEIDSYTCGENVVVASIQPIGSFKSSYPYAGTVVDSDSGIQNMMLKKTSDDLASICRKLDSK